MMQNAALLATAPVALSYEADLCGNIEQALKGLQGYAIMALELIQNADDAKASSLVFDARDDALVVRNDAVFSSCGLADARCPWERTGDPQGVARPCNFHALSRMGSRSKIQTDDQIGRFGIGFVSVYQIADMPIVRSAGHELQLDPLSGRATQRSAPAVGGTEFELRWAAEPSPIREALNASVTPVDVADRIVDEVSGTLSGSLLFLKHLERVELRRNGVTRMTVEIERGSRLITLRYDDGRLERWSVISRDASDIVTQRELMAKYPTLEKLGRSPVVTVATPVDAGPVAGLIYAYLPTSQPTGMPLHVNADFFPHASRQDIVLGGEGHERFWNEALLDAAAAAIGENFELLRDELGADRLWELGDAAHKLRGVAAFVAFWASFSASAKATASAWIVGEAWRSPSVVHLPPEQMTEGELAAVRRLGIDLLHPDLRRYWTVLAQAGVTELRLADIVDRLDVLEGSAVMVEHEQLGDLWAAISTMVELGSKRLGAAQALNRLKAATFLIDRIGDPAGPTQLWRLPPEVDPSLAVRFLPECPFVHPRVLDYPQLAVLVDGFGLDDLARELATEVTTAEQAVARFGTDAETTRSFYRLLTSFPVGDSATEAGTILAGTPILRTGSGFVTPGRGQLPGGFRDPVGHLQLIDTAFFPPGMDLFAETVLGVSVLSFRRYVEEHLDDILAAQPTREQYRVLLTEIVDHRMQLEDEGGLSPLAARAFVRTRAGHYARPRDCYYWSAPLEALLGPDQALWVDSAWMPPPPAGPRLHDLLVGQLGMPWRVSAAHIVRRIREIADGGSLDEVTASVTPIVRHVIENWTRLGPTEREQLRELAGIPFLAAIVDGARDERHFAPNEMYRAGRAAGFASQVPVVELTPLRQAGVIVGEFLDHLSMDAEPDTSVVVAHLEHCIRTGTAPSDLTYQMLSERLERADDVASVDRLADTPFIYSPDLQRFIHPSTVFWQPPPFAGRWHLPSNRMRQRDALYRRLGVRDLPSATDFAALMIEITEDADRSAFDVETHARCVGALAEALDKGEPEAADALASLDVEACLISLGGEPLWTDEAIWLDSEQLAVPFGHVLDHLLIRQPDVPRTVAAKLFSRLAVRQLSDIAELRLAETPDETPAPEATQLLQERSDLLLWLAPNPVARRQLRRLLSQLEIRASRVLRIRAEIPDFEVPVLSPSSPAGAFLERDRGILHVRADAGSSPDWPAAFRAVFSAIEPYCPTTDIPPLIMAATLVMKMSDWAEAEQTLRQSDYRAPEELADGEYTSATELGDAPDDEDIGDEPASTHDEPKAGSADTSEDARDEDPSEAGSTVSGGVGHAGGVGGARQPSDDGAGGASAGGPYKPGNTTGDGTAGANDEGGARADPRYGSSRPSGGFGDDPLEKGGPGGQARAQAASGSTRSTFEARRGSVQKGETSSERQARRSRMLAYVGKTGSREVDDGPKTSPTEDISGEIDAAAVRAVLKYEANRGAVAEEQPHGNPGYDVISTIPSGRRRLIEIKGLHGDWTERGVKLSHVQYGMAESHPEEFWIYVVENAIDLERQRVTAIANPFGKVEEYWFDHNWRDASEEVATARDVNLRVGAKLRHPLWGIGTIVEIKQSGTVPYLTIDFGKIEGRRGVPYKPNLTFVS